jgi:hypothetical protein
MLKNLSRNIVKKLFAAPMLVASLVPTSGFAKDPGALPVSPMISAAANMSSLVPTSGFAKDPGALPVPPKSSAAANKSSSSSGWVKTFSARLFEYADPAYARTGTYDLYFNAQLRNPPYRFPVYAVVNIGPRCISQTSWIHGGVERGWLFSVTTDPWVSQIQPRAFRAWGVVFAYSNDGSSGTTLECPEPQTSPDRGYHWLFEYATQYQYRDQLGLEIGDLYMCEINRFNPGGPDCRWYHVYQ